MRQAEKAAENPKTQQELEGVASRITKK